MRNAAAAVYFLADPLLPLQIPGWVFIQGLQSERGETLQQSSCIDLHNAQDVVALAERAMHCPGRAIAWSLSEPW